MPAGMLGAASASASASAACAWTAWASATLRFLLFFTPGSAAEGSMMGGMMGSSVPFAPAFWAAAIASCRANKSLTSCHMPLYEASCLLSLLGRMRLLTTATSVCSPSAGE